MMISGSPSRSLGAPEWDRENRWFPPPSALAIWRIAVAQPPSRRCAKTLTSSTLCPGINETLSRPRFSVESGL